MSDFNSQQEIWAFLAGGGTVLGKQARRTWKFTKGVLTRDGRECTNVTFHQSSLWEKYIPWEDCIPENGRLCWVSNIVKEPSSGKARAYLQIVTRRHTTPSRYVTKIFPWLYATPLTNEEISEFLWP